MGMPAPLGRANLNPVWSTLKAPSITQTGSLPLSYSFDSLPHPARLFPAFRDLPYPALLDGAMPGASGGRFSYLTADPFPGDAEPRPPCGPASGRSASGDGGRPVVDIAGASPSATALSGRRGCPPSRAARLATGATTSADIWSASHRWRRTTLAFLKCTLACTTGRWPTTRPQASRTWSPPGCRRAMPAGPKPARQR